MPRRRTARSPGGTLRVAAAAVLLLLCAACSGPPAPTPSAPTPSVAGTAAVPEGVGVRIFQNRLDYAARVLQIAVSNDGPSDFALVSASFASPQFTRAARYAIALTLSPGMIRNLPVRLADPVCTDDASGPASVTLTWAIADGGTSSATVTPPDDTGALERIRTEDCLVAAVDAVVAMAPAEHLRIGVGGSAWLDITLTPTGAAGSVSIDRVGDTTLIAPPSGTDWPVGLTMNAASPRRIISLTLRPARCDPHAIAEDKRGAVLPMAMRTDAGPAGTYNLSAGDTLRREIYAWITASCSG